MFKPDCTVFLTAGKINAKQITKPSSEGDKKTWAFQHGREEVATSNDRMFRRNAAAANSSLMSV